MSRSRLAALLAPVTLLGAACGRPAPPAAPARPPPAKLEHAGGEALARWLRASSFEVMTPGTDEVRVVRLGMAAAGDRVEVVVEAPEDRCLLLLARAGAEVDDIDLYAYADDGAVLGEDDAPDPAPIVIVCPPHPRRIFVAARVAAGRGVVGIGAQSIPAGDAERVRATVEAASRSARANARPGRWPDLDTQIARHRRRVGGQWQELRRLAVPVDPRIVARVSAVVDEDRCLDVLAVPEDSVSHLELTAIAPDGHTLGRALATERERAFIICSSASEAITLELRPHAGRGMVAVVLARTAPGERPDSLAAPLRFELAPTGALAEHRAANDARLSALGYPAPSLLGEGALAVGRRVSLDVSLPPGCARIDVVTGRPMRGLEAQLWSRAGSLIARDVGTGRASLFACGPGGPARLDLDATDAPGPYAIELRADGDGAPALTLHPLAASRLVSRLVERGLIGSARQLTAAAALPLADSARHDESLTVPIGRCVDATLALDSGASGAEVRLLDAASGAELALGRDRTTASARACALDRAETLQVRAELRVLAGSAVGLFATRLLAPRP
ncbi:MAG: hypothetical protein OZ921_03425 [Sorangiineae bacterium]|nr:hypothetical protein [Polyangiaceae bacterium]MEB2321540.1 hypothetical protein [Sorangiineae bacterium]